MKTFANGFKDTTWLITGGTSGLGLALTEALINEGAQVAVVARGERRLMELARKWPIVPIVADVADKESIHRISGEALARLGSIDVLVNNASALGPTPLKLLMDTECEDFEQVLQTNLLAPFRLIKAISPGMLLGNGGWVINISSDAAVSTYPKWGAYGVSKAALDHLSRIWSAELGDKGIGFLALDPGDMDTPMHAAAIPDPDPSHLKSPRKAADQLLRLIRENANGDVRRTL